MSYVNEAGHGRDPNRKIFCMGALIGSETEWEKNFDLAWLAACEEEGVTDPLHAKDLAHFRGQFQGWTEHSRQRLLQKLLGTLREANIIPIGIVVYTPDFAAIERRQIRGTKLRLRDPHFYAFQQVTRTLAFVADQQVFTVALNGDLCRPP